MVDMKPRRPFERRLREEVIAERVDALVRDVPHWPTKDVVFKDISPVLEAPGLLVQLGWVMSVPFVHHGVTKVLAVEARGFLLAPFVAKRLEVGVVMARKKGKLPLRDGKEVICSEFEKEYGKDQLCVQEAALTEKDQVLVVDDVLALGGTALAAADLIERCDANLTGFSFLGELEFLHGRERLWMEHPHTKVATLLTWR